MSKPLFTKIQVLLEMIVTKPKCKKKKCVHKVLKYFHQSDIKSSTNKQLIASPDSEKALDSVEWEFLWEVICRFGFGPKFLTWLAIIYRAPKAHIRTNSSLFERFLLQRGTRQGCPLSPSVFALALEPLAILIWDSRYAEEKRVGSLEEKISLYADDTLLYLHDSVSSLWAALRTFNKFGHFSKILINWSKSILSPRGPPGLVGCSGYSIEMGGLV